MASFKNSSGVLNKSQTKNNDRAPDYYGTLKLDDECIHYLVQQVKAGNNIVNLEIAGWLKSGNKGKFVSLSVSEPYNKDRGNYQPQIKTRQGGYQDRQQPRPQQRSFDDPDDQVPF